MSNAASSVFPPVSRRRKNGFGMTSATTRAVESAFRWSDGPWGPLCSSHAQASIPLPLRSRYTRGPWRWRVSCCCGTPPVIHRRIARIVVRGGRRRFILGPEVPGLAAASIRVPSTLKYSSDSSPPSVAHTTSSHRARPTWAYLRPNPGDNRRPADAGLCIAPGPGSGGCPTLRSSTRGWAPTLVYQYSRTSPRPCPELGAIVAACRRSSRPAPLRTRRPSPSCTAGGRGKGYGQSLPSGNRLAQVPKQSCTAPAICSVQTSPRPSTR